MNTYAGDVFTHKDGRVCRWQKYIAGNTRDGKTKWAYWYRLPTDPPNTRRYCGRHTTPATADAPGPDGSYDVPLEGMED